VDEITNEWVSRFVSAMDDNFNSSEAFAAIHDLVREGNRLLEGDDDAALGSVATAFLELTHVLGFTFGSGDDSRLVSDLVKLLIEMREDARKEKAFERADAIRERLADMGVVLEDTASGTRWRISAVRPPTS
jgi:cysteinyl-tRNA synthetase